METVQLQNCPPKTLSSCKEALLLQRLACKQLPYQERWGAEKQIPWGQNVDLLQYQRPVICSEISLVATNPGVTTFSNVVKSIKLRDIKSKI